MSYHHNKLTQAASLNTANWHLLSKEDISNSPISRLLLVFSGPPSKIKVSFSTSNVALFLSFTISGFMVPSQTGNNIYCKKLWAHLSSLTPANWPTSESAFVPRTRREAALSHVTYTAEVPSLLHRVTYNRHFWQSYQHNKKRHHDAAFSCSFSFSLGNKFWKRPRRRISQNIWQVGFFCSH